MAANVTYHEVVIKGSPKTVRGLLTGLALGAGEDLAFWFHEDEDIVDPTIPRTARRTIEKLHLLPTTLVRVVVTGTIAKLLRARRRAIEASGVCEVVEIDRVKKARFELCYHTYAKRYDDEVQILLKDLPRGVKLLNPVHDVELDPDAEGVEAYSPAHSFESRGGGIIEGRFDLVLDLRNRLDVHPLIDCEAVELLTS
jgi:hypothetical protein